MVLWCDARSAGFALQLLFQPGACHEISLFKKSTRGEAPPTQSRLGRYPACPSAHPDRLRRLDLHATALRARTAKQICLLEVIHCSGFSPPEAGSYGLNRCRSWNRQKRIIVVHCWQPIARGTPPQVCPVNTPVG
jgi:hypothetical protein